MILYNVTINIEQTVEIQWLDWMKQKHIPEILNTRCFTSARFSRLTSHKEPDSTNYIVQFLCDEDAKLNEFKALHDATFKQKEREKFGDKMNIFNTELKVIEDFYPNQS